MKYILSCYKPNNHYVSVECIANEITADETLIQLPSWRPGRYELGNFAKNVQQFIITDKENKPLRFQKITKDCWKVQTKGISEVHIKYNYFSAEINAGSSFIDASQLYVNPVNCFVYIPERMNEECELVLQLPNDYKVACALSPLQNKQNINCFVAKDFHELADSPFIASNSLQQTEFIINNKKFILWFQGECKPDMQKLTSDFTKFCNEQLQLFNHAPFNTYHFLFQILPHKMYHGVEHTHSTVIALGPGYNLMKGELYADLLGVSCHELFHAWNIKTIRPVEMQPYDYTKENYSKLGYVCEGITTYYGDYLLFRCGVFNEGQYFKTFEERLQKHFDNFGRFNLSVADSSFDTWLDGYSIGAPNRKTSIYDEGCLLAFVTDIFIRKNSTNIYCLDDLMRFLYNEFALKHIGYTEQDYKGVVEHFANTSFDDIFMNYINGTFNYEPLLKDALQYIGCEFVKLKSAKFHEHALGIKINDAGGVCKIASIYPNSVADLNGLSINDEILSINNMHIKPDGSGTTFTEWCNYFGNTKLEFTVNSSGIKKTIEMVPQPEKYYFIASIQKNPDSSKESKNNYELWSKNKF